MSSSSSPRSVGEEREEKSPQQRQIPIRSRGGDEGRENPQRPQNYPAEELFPDPDQPLQSAWDDVISLSTSSGKKYNVKMMALNTRLRDVVRGSDATAEGSEFTVSSMAEYEVLVPNVQGQLYNYDGGQHMGFEMKARCLLSLPESQEEDQSTMPESGECVFLYEVSVSIMITYEHPKWLSEH